MCQNPSVASFFITLAVPHKTGRKNGLENGETWPKMDFVFLLVLLHVPATSETLLPSKLKSEIWKSQVYWNLCQLIYTSYLLLIFLTLLGRTFLQKERVIHDKKILKMKVTLPPSKISSIYRIRIKKEAD